MMTQRQLELLDTPRWAWLRDYLDLWCADPLAASDASTVEQVTEAEERVGPLPAILREWFELVGARLRDIQDTPAKPPKLRVVDGRLAVWTENQGVWQILACPRPDGQWDDDPPCVATEDFDFAQPLSATLQAMTLSDTIAGIMAGLDASRLEGPLGYLAPQVRGGMLEDATDWDTFRELPEHAVPCNPFYEPGLMRGDQTTVLRDDSSWILWMTATDEAFEFLDARFNTNPPNAEHEVVLRLPRTIAHTLSQSEPNERSAWDGVGQPDCPVGVKTRELVQQTVGDLGHVGQSEQSDVARFWITTKTADAVVARLLSAIPQPLLDAAKIIVVSRRLAIPREVHPVH